MNSPLRIKPLCHVHTHEKSINGGTVEERLGLSCLAKSNHDKLTAEEVPSSLRRIHPATFSGDRH